jgi:PAS domain S-box-containing protein
MVGPPGTHLPATQLLLMQIVAHALDLSDDIVLVLQPGGTAGLVMLGGNDAFCRTTGIALADLPGRRFASLACPETAPNVLARIEHAAATAVALQAEMLCRRQDGGQFWLGLHVMPSVDPHSLDRRCVLLGRDITLRHQARQQNQAVQVLLAKALISVDVAVAILTVAGQVIKTNPRLDRLLGLPGHAMDGTMFIERVLPADRPVLEAVWRGQANDGLEARHRVRLLRADGGTSITTITSAAPDHADAPRFRILTVIEEPSLPELFQVAGKIRLIGLDEVKAALGARWPAVRERALAAAEHVLGRRLGPKDSFSRTKDDGFLICFADLAEEAASFTAAMIGREIRSRLIGQGEEPEAATVTAIAANLKLPPGTRAADQVPHDILDARLAVRRSEIEALARQTLASAMGTAACSLAPVFGRDGRQVVAQYARLPAVLLRRVTSASAALPPAERAGFDIDALTLRLAGQQALELTLQGSTGQLFVDIGFEVFQSRISTDAFLEVCRKLDPVVRQGLVMVLNHLPQGLTSSRMIDCIHRLRPFCRAVGFEIEEAELPDFDLALASNPILVIDSERFATAANNSQRVERLRTQLHTLRARLMVRNVATRQIGDRLLTMGVDFVAGLAAEAA